MAELSIIIFEKYVFLIYCWCFLRWYSSWRSFKIFNYFHIFQKIVKFYIKLYIIKVLSIVIEETDFKKCVHRDKRNISLTKTLALTTCTSYTEQYDKTQNKIITLKNNIIRDKTIL